MILLQLGVREGKAGAVWEPKRPQAPEAGVMAELQQNSPEHKGPEKQEWASVQARTMPKDHWALRRLLGEGRWSAVSSHGPRAVAAPAPPDHVYWSSSCSMYCCTQASLGLAQICLPRLVRKLWSKKKDEELRVRSQEKSPSHHPILFQV